MYGLSKTAFGWPDNPAEHASTTKSMAHSGQGGEEEDAASDILPVVSDKPLSHLGRSGREEGREGEREGGREGEREGEREGGKERRTELGDDFFLAGLFVMPSLSSATTMSQWRKTK